MKPGGPSSKRVDGPPPSGAPAARRQTFGRQVPERGGAGEIDVHGASSRTLTGEIGLFEFQIVFAEVFICPETMRLHLKSLRETHFEATVTRFEYSSEFGRESEVKRSGPGRVAHRETHFFRFSVNIWQRPLNQTTLAYE